MLSTVEDCTNAVTGLVRRMLVSLLESLDQVEEEKKGHLSSSEARQLQALLSTLIVAFLVIAVSIIVASLQSECFLVDVILPTRRCLKVMLKT